MVAGPAGAGPMSYLDLPRLCFSGQFQVDISTINNVVRYYDNAAFKPQYQELNADGDDGGWNPDGTGIFRLVGCRITGARLGDRRIATRDDDAVIGMALESADDRVFGKLVDLDPQQQMVSQIWGMSLRLTDGTEPRLFSGDYVPAAFTNLWQRQQEAAPHDQVLAAVYQSVLKNVVWSGQSPSAVLDALREACADGLLSIDMNVYGYGRDPASPRYTVGRVNGTIGPQRAGEPRHFVMGRQMVAATPAGNPWQPTTGVAWFQCKVDEARRTVAADFGNCLEIETAEGDLVNQGKLFLAVLKTDTGTLPATVAADDVAILGAVNYLEDGWYAQTAGVQDFAYDDPWIVANIAQRPLLLLTPLAGNSYTVLVPESLGGLYVRADDFVCRLDPGGKPGKVELYASRYGKPLQGSISFFPNMGVIGVTGGGGPPDVKIPAAGPPPDGVAYPDSLPTDANGKATLSLKAIPLDPPMPRGYIDGQLYGIGYELAGQPAGTVVNPWNYISILVFSPFEAPAEPTWHADIQPILTQYGNLYPIMSRHLVRLDCYDSVVKNLRILRLAFGLPPENPNHMPVTRDLSAAKRAMILKWLDNPLKGEPVTAAAAETAGTPRPLATIEPIAMDLHPLQTRGKTAVLLEYQARHLAKERS
jgi:hypothetical protein